MSEFETDIPAENPAPVDASPADAEETAAPVAPARRKRGWLARLGIGAGVTVAVLAVAGVALYNFGGMSGSVNDPAMRQQYEQLVASGQVKPVEKRFVIPIPGCQCHSTDPYLTEQHRNRRINQCSSCHSRG